MFTTIIALAIVALLFAGFVKAFRVSANKQIEQAFDDGFTAGYTVGHSSGRMNAGGGSVPDEGTDTPRRPSPGEQNAE